MNSELILLPALAMVLLTFIVWLRMLVTRLAEIRRLRIRPQDLATRAGTGAALKNVSAPSDNLLNLFEMPVLFYLLVTLLYTAGASDNGYLWLASLYAVLRYAHSFIHITYNRVMHRFMAYLGSAVVLWVMWGRFAWQIVEWMTLNDSV